MQNRIGLARRLEPYFFLAPVLVTMIALMGYPLLRGISIAFFDYNLARMNNIRFNGFANFDKIFTGDKYIGVAAWNTVKWVGVSVLAQFTFGLILALALRKPFKGRGIYQSIVFLPWAFSSFVVGLMFRWAFNGEYGVINDLLKRAGFIMENISWLGSSGLSLYTVIIAMVWLGIPFFGIMYLAALQSIPADLYEAASIDGCGRIKAFFKITFPYIQPTVTTTLLLRTIWIFNAIELIMVMTGGGPAYSSETIASYMYAQAYGTHDFGMAAAIGLLIMTGMVVYTLIYLRATKYNSENAEF
jgi:multiple sugar transport system permease protein